MSEFYRCRALTALRCQAGARGQKLFAFEASAAVAEVCERLGFELRPGAMVIRDVDASALGPALGLAPEEAIQAADLVRSESSHFLGPWSFQAGDRM